MSLISEALKRAREEQEIAPANGAGPSRNRVVALGFAAALIAGGAAVVHFSQEKELPPPAPAVEKPVAAVATPMPEAVPEIAPEAPAPEPPKALVITAKKEIAEEKAPPPKEPAATPDPALEALVGAMRVSLARAATGRCVIDGVVLQVGETALANPKLTILEVRDNAVVLVDEAGLKYTAGDKGAK